MKKSNLFRRMLSLLLVVAMLAGFACPAGAVGADSELHFTLEQIDNSAVTAQPQNLMGSPETPAAADMDEIVRVTILLEKTPTIGAGFQLKGIGTNVSAMSYRQDLRSEQNKLQNTIERQVLQDRELDVVWNLTLAANLISANVPRWAIEKIAELKGVKSVAEETCYAPDVVSVGGDYSTDMAVSGQMTGAADAWLEGYTGAGSRIAVIDTGLDTDHQSFSPEAFDHALAEVEAEKGLTYDLLDPADISAVLTQLNSYRKMAEQGMTLTAEELYFSTKAAYGFNYVDGDLDITHDYDNQGEHGSHVAGIAAANRYIEKNGEFVDALSSVFVAGNAPDAQILVMKVFGKEGGAFDSDILASIEDAMLLGADAVNLSLGSTTAGASYDSTYQQIMERVMASGMTVIASAGNDGAWSDYTTNHYLYSDGVNLDTVGSPGSFASFMAVASADNDGSIGSSIVVGGETMGYTETLSDDSGYGYGNNPLASLDTSSDGSGTELDFVYIDGFGAAADYAGIDLTGKIAVCSRGGDLYYYEKANIAAELGAAALMVYNNEPGITYADLNGINYSMPVITVSEAVGAAIAAVGQEQTSASGIPYRVGKLTVRAALSGNYDDSPYKSISYFSSFGVPGDLSLKPDITAPGGNIYSVNGAVPETDQYELMSGTSMAAPQVAGLAAVVKQYLREQDLSFEGMTQRALANALLMSTAEPMLSSEGVYYPVIQQGAGLADVSAAVRTPAFLTVDGMEDGMVKAELGDDAARTGEYSFSFKLNNLTDASIAYHLDANAFTQNVFFDEAGLSYLDLLCRNLEAEAEFTVNGVALNAADENTIHYDFNGDGRVTRADGQALLDHVTLGTALAANADHADLSGDGKVTTYDVHLFLNRYQSAVEVPANGSVTVSVTIRLSDDEKARLDKENPNGAYVQAFVRAMPLVTDEGEQLPMLSLPVLAFYGDWSDPSMYDVGTQITFATGEEQRSSYLNNTYGNSVGIIYGDKPYEVYYYGGNPIVPDEQYIPERNAINTERGDCFYQWSYAPIRTAAASRFQAMNTTTGEVWEDRENGPVGAAFYYYTYQSWMDTPQYLEIDLIPDLEVGEYGLLKLSLATEYSVHNGKVDWDALGKGATMEVPFTVDVEAPEILDVVVDTEANVMRVTASDDQYLAGVVLYDVTGNRRLSWAGTTADAKPGETITFEVPLEKVDGYKFIVQTSDYAANYATYEIRQTIGEPEPLPTRLAFDENFGCWSTFAKEGYYWNTSKWFDSNITVTAATAIGEYAIATDPSNKLYIIPVEDMTDEIFVAKLDYKLSDMAYDASTDTVYGITADGLLLSIDKFTGETVELGTVGVDTNTLANDGNGTFYCLSVVDTGADNYYSRYRFDLYAFTLDETGAPAEPVLVGSPTSGSTLPSGISSMEYDPVNKILSLLARIPSYSYDYTYYYEFDPATGTSLITDYYPPMPFTKAASGLIFPQWGEEWGDWVTATDEPALVEFAKDEVEVLLGLTTQLSASVMPWNLSNKDLIFTSADESIATVTDKGVVTGVDLGTTTIRAASVLDESVYAECTVTVKDLDVTVNGVLMDEVGNSLFYSWDLASNEGHKRGNALNNSPMAVTRVPGTDTFYLLDSSKGTMHLLDAEGKDLVTPTDEYYQQNFWIWDLAYSQQFSTEDAPAAFGIRENAVIAPFTLMAPTFTNFEMGRYGVSFLAGIASGGYEKITYQDWYGNDMEADSEAIYMIDEGGDVWKCNMFQTTYSWDMVVSEIPSDLDVHFPVGFDGRSSLVFGEDNALYFSAWTGDTSELYRLVYDDISETYLSTHLGNFGEDVWPAVILDVTANAPKAAVAPQGTVRYYASAPEGGLNAIQVETGEAESGIRVDTENGTVTVPVAAIDSTNGLFTLDYDAELLTLAEVKSGSVMTSVDTNTSGTVRVGYADANAVNATVATLVFRFDKAMANTETVLALTTLEDGSAEPVSAEELTVQLSHVCPSADFVDVNEGDWWHEAVDYVVEKGYMNGMDATHYGPAVTMNRAQLVTVLYRMEGQPAVNNTGVFTDVPADQFYTEAAYWALEAGITTGATATTFNPGGQLTRTELVTFMYRYAKYKGYDTSATADLSVYRDEDQILSFAVDAWNWSVTHGIVTGMTSDTLAPMNLTNRAQAAVIFQRFDNTFA